MWPGALTDLLPCATDCHGATESKACDGRRCHGLPPDATVCLVFYAKFTPVPAIRKVGDKFRAEVRMRGVYASESFSSKAAARKWATEREQEIEDRRLGRPVRKTLLDAIKRYRVAVSEKKRTGLSEAKLLNRLEKVAFAKRPLSDITVDDWAAWRETLGSVHNSNRWFNLIRHIYRHICVDWEWLPTNPLTRLRNFPDPPPRRLLWSDTDVLLMLKALHYPGNREVRQRVAIGFLFALETGMREGEIFSLSRDQISGRVATLPLTKNGSPRAVPLSSRALALLAELPPSLDPVFGVSAASASAIFRKYRPASLAHLRFHDARHTAATRLGSSGRLTVHELCTMFGWRDLSMSLAYFHPTPESLAAKLD